MTPVRDDLNLVGTAGNDTLNGDLIDAGSYDTLSGLAGNDILNGLAGNDTYIIDNSGDSISEAVDAGIDTVRAGFSYSLPANVENLILSSAAALNGAGNALANTLTGNAAANTLKGGGGADPASRDLVTDFSRAQGDKIDVKAIDANSLLAGMQKWAYVAAFTGAPGQATFDAAHHLALFDQNGDKAAEFAIELAGVTAMGAADFIFA